VRILSLDLARVAGFAIGEAGEVPRSGSIRLAKPGADHHVAARTLAVVMRDQFFKLASERPDIIVAEQFMDPSAQLSGAVVVTQLLLHGAVDAIAAVYGVEVRRVPASTIRKHFCGKAYAMPRSRGVTRTSKEKAEARAATKAMIVQRCHVLGYMPRAVTDDNRADALAGFDWATAHIARAAPREFVLFGEAAQ